MSVVHLHCNKLPMSALATLALVNMSEKDTLISCQAFAKILDGCTRCFGYPD